MGKPKSKTKSKFEVQLVIETTSTHYVEAENEEEAREKAEALWLEGEEDENPASGWSSVSHANVEEMAPAGYPVPQSIEDEINQNTHDRGDCDETCSRCNEEDE